MEVRDRINRPGNGTNGDGSRRPRAAIYARFSTANQSSETANRQVEECRRYAAAHNIDVLADHIYIDEARSGTTTSGRARYMDLMAVAMPRDCPFQVILVFSRSRWTRGFEAQVDEHNLRKRGIRVISVTEPFTAEETPESDMLRGIIDEVNKYFPKLTTRASVLQLRKNALDGYWNGGDPPDGYSLIRLVCGADDDGKPIMRTRLILDEQPGPHDLCKLPRYRMVVRIFDLWLEGSGLIRIAEVLYQEGWRAKSGPERIGTSTIRAILHTPNYTGVLHWGIRNGAGWRKDEGDVVKSQKQSHPPIITPDQFAAAQARFRKHKPTQRSARRARLSAERVACGVCDDSFTIDCRKDTSSDPRLFCDRKHRFGKDACTNPGISQPRLDHHVRVHWLRRILNSDTIIRFIQLWNAEVKRMSRDDDPESRQLRESLEKVEREMKNLKDAVAKGDVDARHLGQEIEERSVLRERLLQNLAARKPQNKPGLLNLDARSIKANVMGLRRLLIRAPLKIQMQAFQAHVTRVVVYPPNEDGWRNVEIVYDPSALITKNPEAWADRELTRIKHGSANGN